MLQFSYDCDSLVAQKKNRRGALTH